MANGHGGRRDGAGRKSGETAEYQAKMRAQFEAVVGADDLRAVIRTALDQARKGDAGARSWLTPWLVGAEPKAVTVDHAGRVDVNVSFTDETPERA